jgi:hypothetical protein
MVFRINTLRFDRKTYAKFDASRGHMHADSLAA